MTDRQVRVGPEPQVDRSGLGDDQLARLIELCHDWRYSDEFIGNVLRSYLGRSHA